MFRAVIWERNLCLFETFEITVFEIAVCLNLGYIFAFLVIEKLQ